MTISLRPYPVKHALPFVRSVHRRLPVVQGGMWAVAAEKDGAIVGVALVGRPQARMLQDGRTLEVLRLAVVEGYPNACSMLYGACARAARSMGAENLVTYTHGDEYGASLKASGWLYDGLTDGGEWSRDGRARAAAIDAEGKGRWWAPWSRRARS